MWWLTIGAGLVGSWLGTLKTREKALRRERLERAYEDVKETKNDIKSKVEHAKERLHDEIEATAHDIKQKVDGVNDKLSNESRKAQEDIKRLVNRIKNK
ncbi:hypothetical protein Ae201684P_006319 [Aphanomyces euteiches]|nr:hypothetical protein Ae201684P_006319 [Aphanomyces euteiches]KAH9148789.1 hypothetical protein AeRB84_007974 [Aphanomyces euteiches]